MVPLAKGAAVDLTTGAPTGAPGDLVLTDQRKFEMAVIRNHCLEFHDATLGDEPLPIRECRVSEFAEFGTVDGQTYYYAIYCLIPNDATDGETCDNVSLNAGYYDRRGLAIFVRDGSSGNAQLLLQSAEGRLFYDRPEIIPIASGTILYLPIVIEGTAHENLSAYYLRQAKMWKPIEAQTWFSGLIKKVPAGLEIRKGVWPDLQTMHADAYLYRKGDANCCPTGGVARIRLALHSNKLLVESIVIKRPSKHR